MSFLYLIMPADCSIEHAPNVGKLKTELLIDVRQLCYMLLYTYVCFSKRLFCPLYISFKLRLTIMHALFHA